MSKITRARPILAKDTHTNDTKVFSIEGWKHRAYGQIMNGRKVSKYRKYSEVIQVHGGANKRAIAKAGISTGLMQKPATTGNADADAILQDALETTEENPDTTSNEDKPTDYKKMKVADLKAICKGKKIELTGEEKRADYIKLLTNEQGSISE